MLNCKLCDYYHSLADQGSSNPHLAKCDFTGLSFIKDVENLDIDYPCGNMSYADYLNKIRMPEVVSNVHKLINDDWRLIYLKGHVKEPTKRALRGA